jgi:Tol biopolymer transport system component
MERDGTNQKKIADNALKPSWSRDGKVLAYCGKGGTCLHHFDTGKVTHPMGTWKSWYGGGGEFVATRSGKGMLLGGGRLWRALNPSMKVVELDGDYKPVNVTPMGAGYIGCNQRWSSTGRWVLFAHHDPKHRGGIILWRINPDGTDPQRFATPARGSWPGYAFYAESPDGTMWLYASRGSLYVMRLSDGATVRLFEMKGKAAVGMPWWHGG